MVLKNFNFQILHAKRIRKEKKNGRIRLLLSILSDERNCSFPIILCLLFLKLCHSYRTVKLSDNPMRICRIYVGHDAFEIEHLFCRSVRPSSKRIARSDLKLQKSKMSY